MFFIREAQEQIRELYLNKKIFSMIHFYIGQEAVASGVCCALRLEDKVLGSHRSHGHYLAKGGNFRKLICELLGKANGATKGKGGSMHLIDRNVNFVGSSPLLGSAVPIAAGVGFAQNFKKVDSITAVFYGDGASEEGVVYETYNLAALYSVPVLFILENNLNSINSNLADRRSAGYNLEYICKGLGIEKYQKVDGNSFVDVYSSAKNFVKYVRSEKKPALIECMTYRHLAHSTPLMEESYRTEDNFDLRVKKDSLRNLRNLLVTNFNISDDLLCEYEYATKLGISQDIDFAINSDYPAKEELYKNVFG